MRLHSFLNLSLVERVKKCRFSNTNKNQNCTKIVLGRNRFLLGFVYSTLTFMSKRAPRASQPAPPAAAPAEPYALHNPAAVRQHLRGLGDQEVLRLHTSDTNQRIRVTTLVQAPTCHRRWREPAPHGGPNLGAPIDWGRHLVGHPVPEREDTQGRTRYREPNMAHPRPSATPSNTKEWERETWVARIASLSNFRHHVPEDIPSPDDRQPAPSTYMTLMYNLHYTLSATHYHTSTGHWVVHGTNSLLPADYAPPTHTTQASTRTPGRTSRTTPTSGALGKASPWTRCFPSAAAARALVGRCIALPSGHNGPGGSPRTGACGRSHCAPSRGRPPRTAGDPPPPRPTTLQLCPYMVAARLMALLWPGPHTPTQSFPHFTEEDMPGIQRCFFRTLDYLQQTHPHVPEQIWTPPAQPRQRHHTTTRTHRSPGKARTHAWCPKPQPRSHYSQDPASYPRCQSPGPSAVPHSPLLRLRLHNIHHHNHLILHHQHVLIQHSTPQAAAETSQTGP